MIQITLKLKLSVKINKIYKYFQWIKERDNLRFKN